MNANGKVYFQKEIPGICEALSFFLVEAVNKIILHSVNKGRNFRMRTLVYEELNVSHTIQIEIYS